MEELEDCLGTPLGRPGAAPLCTSCNVTVAWSLVELLGLRARECRVLEDITKIWEGCAPPGNRGKEELRQQGFAIPGHSQQELSRTCPSPGTQPLPGLAGRGAEQSSLVAEVNTRLDGI